MKIRKILVAFDGSASSKKAFRDAADLAITLNAKITILSVIHVPDFSPSIDEIAETVDEAEKHLHPLLNELKDFGQQNELQIKTVVKRGHAAETIIKYASDNEIDLIVMGTRGLGGFKKMLIGSIAQKVVSYSNTPVMVIRQ
ncbi:universal stress protein [Desulfosporosinus sp. FKA]|uniref:universal stress protein n=1 Tax=Desulfosporosinus sp. FKA TaxID=1969834 RepID=UPI000B49CD74|nr:universal stress protein [Desulfosporosinus sp. FKA]